MNIRVVDITFLSVPNLTQPTTKETVDMPPADSVSVSPHSVIFQQLHLARGRLGNSSRDVNIYARGRPYPWYIPGHYCGIYDKAWLIVTNESSPAPRICV